MLIAHNNEEGITAKKRMKSEKAADPDDTPVEGWRCLEERSLDFLTRLFTTDDAWKMGKKRAGKVCKGWCRTGMRAVR